MDAIFGIVALSLIFLVLKGIWESRNIIAKAIVFLATFAVLAFIGVGSILEPGFGILVAVVGASITAWKFTNKD